MLTKAETASMLGDCFAWACLLLNLMEQYRLRGPITPMSVTTHRSVCIAWFTTAVIELVTYRLPELLDLVDGREGRKSLGVADQSELPAFGVYADS